MASKMNKKELYQAFKDLKQEQLIDSLFHSQEIQELNKSIDTMCKYSEYLKEQIQELKKENEELKKGLKVI